MRVEVPGLFSTEEVSKEKAAELLKLKPGVYQTQDVIRSVAIADGCMSVMETTSCGPRVYNLKIPE